MPTDSEMKQRMILDLIASSQQAYRLHAFLVLNGGDPQQAEKAGRQSDELDDTIDNLLAQTMAVWSAAASKSVKDVRRLSADVKAAVADIERRVGQAQRIVEALGYVDKLIELAATFMV